MSRRKARRPTIQRRDINISELEMILDQARSQPLDEAGFHVLKGAVDTLAFLTREIEEQGASIRRLRSMLFGPSTEKSNRVLGNNKRTSPDSSETGKAEATNDTSADTADVPDAHEGSGSPGIEPEQHDSDEGGGAPERDTAESRNADEKAAEDCSNDGKKKRPGHGRNGVAAYTGANRVKVPHPSLNHGDRCPGCAKGKIYTCSEPRKLIRITGMAPLGATIFEKEEFRCGACGEIFTAPSPEGVGEEKYDETAASMIAVLKYGTGMPFNRLESLQGNMGIPLPAATQYELVAKHASNLAPAHEELISQAAQGAVLHNDDTRMKVLALMKPKEEEETDDDGLAGRKSSNTTAIVSKRGTRRIALFFTGRKHSGENMEDVLSRRDSGLPDLIQMSDALAANRDGNFSTTEANCNAHARRQFVELLSSFPDDCRRVIETYREIYIYDDMAREFGFSDEGRLLFHQATSGPLLEELKSWMKDKIDNHEVEPNSSLGDAMDYMLDHWDGLTLFLRVPGAPLDNNICEQVLKKSILNRKNAYFYKTMNGARIGDMYMSLILTAELNGANPFDYLVALMRHPKQVAQDPSAWMPWNYQETLRSLDADAQATPLPLPYSFGPTVLPQEPAPFPI